MAILRRRKGPKYLSCGALGRRLCMLVVAQSLLQHFQVSFHLLPRGPVRDDQKLKNFESFPIHESQPNA